MKTTKHIQDMVPVGRCTVHGAAPIPQEGAFTEAKEVRDLSGFTHGCGTCGLKQGTCKLTLNIKKGVVEEALIETVGCSGMTHSAAMASEILPGKTVLEALNTDLVCDAINVAMRELFLAACYGRTQTAYSKDGLAVGSGLDDLGEDLGSQVATMYGTTEKGPRYLQVSEGYVRRMGLDEEGCVIGYETVDVNHMMRLIEEGACAQDALAQSTRTTGRFNEAVRTIDPRKE